MIICFLDGSLVVMLNLGLPFDFILLMTLCISIILSEDSLGKTSLILMISLISPLEAYTYAIRNIDTLIISDNNSLECIVQEYTCTLESIWYKNLKVTKITK